MNFTPYRTPRLEVQLRELSLGQSIAICGRSASRHEANTTYALQCIVQPPERYIEGRIEDPRLWTVEERGAVIAHYLAHTIGPTFSIGDTGTFPDYLYAGQTTAEETYIGPVGDDEWYLSPLLGYQAEAIERIVLGQRVELLDGSGKLVGRVGWIIGAMACQLRRAQEEPLEDIGADEFDEWLEERMAFLLVYGDNDSADLREAFMAARFTQRHLLNAHFNDEGVVFVSEVPGRPSARFPVSDLLSERTARFLGVSA